MELIKWWKDKTFLTILAVALLTMVVAFLLAYFIDWGWVLSIVVACLGGYAIRKVIVKKLDELANR